MRDGLWSVNQEAPKIQAESQSTGLFSVHIDLLRYQEVDLDASQFLAISQLLKCQG